LKVAENVGLVTQEHWLAYHDNYFFVCTKNTTLFGFPWLIAWATQAAMQIRDHALTNSMYSRLVWSSKNSYPSSEWLPAASNIDAVAVAAAVLRSGIMVTKLVIDGGHCHD
jgi:hypothetical protein